MADRLTDSTRRNGFSIVDHAVLDDVKVFEDVYEKLIYILLLRHADSRSGACFPSYETLAGKAMCSRRTAIRTVASLVRRGLVAMERTNGRANVYTVKDDVLLGGGRRLADTNERAEECPTVTTSDELRSVGGDCRSPGECPTVTPGVTDSHPNYIHLTRSIELHPPVSPDGGPDEASPSREEIPGDEPAESGIPEPEQTTFSTTTETYLSESDRGIYGAVRERFAIGEGEFARLLELWRRTYADVDVGAEIRRAVAWLAESGRRYRSASKFLGNWLRRAKPVASADTEFEAKARELFAVFWEAYPKHDGERAAFEAFVAIFAPLSREARNAVWKNLESHLAVLLDRIERGEISEERYVPLAKNWLRGIDATKPPERVPTVERWAEASGDA